MRPFLLASARGGTHQNEPAYQVREAERERLGNIAPYGKTEHIGALQTEPTDEDRDVVGLCLEGARRLAARAGDSGTVEQNHGAVGAETVGDQWVPVVHSRAKMRQEQQRSAKLGAETAVRVADPAGFHKLRGRGHV